MTENEAIERIKLSCIDCGSDDCGLCDKATEMAIQALEKQSMVNEILSELREYSQIGTVEEIQQKDEVIATQRDIIEGVYKDYEKYLKIGTIEEFKALKEKNTPKKRGIWKSGHTCCPNCERGVLTADRFCSYCGQALKPKET